MHCKDCEYPLWNLKTRSCPECGKPFLPSEYEFVANSVRFCCPQCDQEYYGTDARGHLEPRAFQCVNCGAPIEMDEMILRPAAGVEESQTRANAMPWLDRDRGSVVKAWLMTVGRSMVSPVRLMRSVPAGSPMSAAWKYAAITVAIIMLVGAGIPWVGLGLGLMIWGGPGDGTGAMLGGTWVTLGGTLGFLAVILVWGLIVHGLLRLGGRVQHPLGRTYQAMCYSVGANVTTAVPCVGLYPFIEVGLVWWVVSATLMVMVAQRVSGARASFAVLVCPIAAIVLAVAGMVGLMFFGMSKARLAASTASAVTQDGETSLVTRALLDYASGHGGAWPAHALELVRDGFVTPWAFVSAGSATYLDAVPAGDTTMEDLASLPEDRRDETIDAVIASRPANVIAYRLGDFVFTYPGVGEDAPTGTWIAILAPDPDRNKVAAINGNFVAGRLDGTTEVIPEGAFAARLAEQNALRAAQGLAPLPPPGSVTHGAPAVER